MDAAANTSNYYQAIDFEEWHTLVCIFGLYDREENKNNGYL